MNDERRRYTQGTTERLPGEKWRERRMERKRKRGKKEKLVPLLQTQIETP